MLAQCNQKPCNICDIWDFMRSAPTPTQCSFLIQETRDKRPKQLWLMGFYSALADHGLPFAHRTTREICVLDKESVCEIVTFPKAFLTGTQPYRTHNSPCNRTWQGERSILLVTYGRHSSWWFYIRFYGSISYYTVPSPILWFHLKLYGSVSNFIILPSLLWFYLKFYGSVSNSVVLSQIVWSYLQCHGYISQILMVLFAILWFYF
jgi:hypothetical protein